MKTTFRVVVSLLILFVGYESMVEAFHLLNQPSDRAVYVGTAMLVSLCVFVPMLLLLVWRKRRGTFW